MGQYHIPVNLSKREFIDPHKLGDGLKLVEQSGSRNGTASALVMLCAASNGRGGGDFPDDLKAQDGSPIMGRWAGDRIAWIGDYAEASDLPQRFRANAIYGSIRRDQDRAEKGKPPVKRGAWKDISDDVVNALEISNECVFFGTGWRGVANLSDIIHGWKYSHWLPDVGRVVDIESKSHGGVVTVKLADLLTEVKAKLAKMSGETGYNDPLGYRYGYWIDERTGARIEGVKRKLNIHELGLDSKIVSRTEAYPETLRGGSGLPLTKPVRKIRPAGKLVEFRSTVTMPNNDVATWTYVKRASSPAGVQRILAARLAELKRLYPTAASVEVNVVRQPDWY